MEITVNDVKNITLNKEISVDGILVKRLTATIKSDGDNISFSDYTYRMDLYKANRAAIRKIEADFEDEVFAEQDKLTDANVTKEDAQGAQAN